MRLRDYQQDIFDQLTESSTNDIVQLDTGAGKTPIEAALAAWAPHTLLVAHRNVLITQISEKLAQLGVAHDTISTEYTRRRCMAAHRRHGKQYIVRGHQTHLVASIASLISARKRGRMMIDASLPWLIVIDEGHHVIPDNQWGALREIFPNARIVGFTATPARMDGESLHESRGGLFTRLVQAKSLMYDGTHTLIELGYLSGIIVYSTAATALPAGQRARHVSPLDWDSGKMDLWGDPVHEYRRLAMGLPAIMMCPSIKNAEDFAEKFRDAGIPAACISSKLSQAEIARLIDAFHCGRILVIMNVDMVGEGFDMPACKALIIATRTASFPRYRQWCGRVMRPDDSGGSAVIIDMTGMCIAHGMPDEPVEWDLLNPPCGPMERKHVVCDGCGRHFLFKLLACPQCGWRNAYLDRPGSFSPGTFWFDIRQVDTELVARLCKQRRDDVASQRLHEELIAPPRIFGDDMVGRTISRLAEWLPHRLRDAGVAVIDINAFLISSSAHDRTFYMRHFTARDIESKDTKKALKAYKKWLSSRSSTATRLSTEVRLTSS